MQGPAITMDALSVIIAATTPPPRTIAEIDPRSASLLRSIAAVAERWGLSSARISYIPGYRDPAWRVTLYPQDSHRFWAARFDVWPVRPFDAYQTEYATLLEGCPLGLMMWHVRWRKKLAGLEKGVMECCEDMCWPRGSVGLVHDKYFTCRPVARACRRLTCRPFSRRCVTAPTP